MDLQGLSRITQIWRSVCSETLSRAWACPKSGKLYACVPGGQVGRLLLACTLGLWLTWPRPLRLNSERYNVGRLSLSATHPVVSMWPIWPKIRYLILLEPAGRQQDDTRRYLSRPRASASALAGIVSSVTGWLGTSRASGSGRSPSGVAAHPDRTVGNQQKSDTVGPERAGVGLRFRKLSDGPIVLSSPFDCLSFYLPSAL